MAELRTVWVVMGAVLVGCTTWPALDSTRERAQAIEDHRVCAARDLAFPSDDYTACRRQLAEARQKEEWLELSMVQLQRRQQAPEFLAVPPPAPYRAIDPRHFRCEARGADQAMWIACRER